MGGIIVGKSFHVVAAAAVAATASARTTAGPAITAAAALVAARTRSAREARPILRLVDAKRASAHVRAVQGRRGVERLLVGAHGHKCETTGATRESVRHD